MIKKLLVANRGEIARRIFATCRLVGIETVAVYTDADADSPHVPAADYAVRLSDGTLSASLTPNYPDLARDPDPHGFHGHPATDYLRADVILAAARRTGVDAIHPGYGFLAEDAEFAAAVLDAGMVWIGPPVKAIATMRSKIEAKALLSEAGVPVLPTIAEPAAVTEFPVLVKAASGADGRGMRVVRDADALAETVTAVSREATAAFGDGTVFCERYVEHGRHIEVQVLADAHGGVVTFGERECSIQRRHQKIIEETPATGVTPKLRRELCEAASAAARAIGYVGAGTVEFLVEPDDEGRLGRFYFLEFSCRLAVEHPVTECVSGSDLVHLQLQIAEGAPLARGGAPPIRGHAIEARLCAEDPAYAWLPSTGTLDRFRVPDVATEFRPLAAPGLRLDSGVRDGSVVGPHHDAMLAKIVAWAPTRHEAARMLSSALAHAEIHGVVTNRDLLVRVLRNPAFLDGVIDTGFLDRHPEVFAPLVSSVDGVRLSCLAATLAGAARRRAEAPVLRSLPSGWRNVPSGWQHTVYDGPAGPVEVGYRLDRLGGLAGWWVRPVDPEELDLAGLGQPGVVDTDLSVKLASATPDRVVLEVSGVRVAFLVHQVGEVSYVDSREGSVALAELPRFPLPEPEMAEGSLVAPVPGEVGRVLVATGQRVAAGDLLLTLETMRVEHPVHAPVAGVVAALPVTAGTQVDTGTVLAVLTPE